MTKLRLQSTVVIWPALASLLLGGCGVSPNFVHAPPAASRVPLPSKIQGVWAREGKDNGERARIVNLDDGTVRVDIFNVTPRPKDKPQEPLVAQALRFDETDWLLIDMRRLAVREGDTYTGNAPYRLIRYALEGENRLCGIEPSANPFAKAIESGQLQGEVQNYVGSIKRVTVSSTGEEWVRWWSRLPASGKIFAQPVFCFQRVN